MSLPLLIAGFPKLILLSSILLLISSLCFKPLDLLFVNGEALPLEVLGVEYIVSQVSSWGLELVLFHL